MTDRFLDGRTALVTGGNRGIGRAVALALAGAGARVGICGRNESTLAATVRDLEALTPGAWWARCDARSEADQEAFFAEARSGTFASATSRAALLWMRGTGTRGWILPIVSQAGKVPFEMRAAYCASKWGALGFAKCLALEAKRDGVRVTAICPASVATDFQAGNPAGTDWMLEAGDVAAAVLYVLRQEERVEVEEIVLRCRTTPRKG